MAHAGSFFDARTAEEFFRTRVLPQEEAGPSAQAAVEGLSATGFALFRGLFIEVNGSAGRLARASDTDFEMLAPPGTLLGQQHLWQVGVPLLYWRCQPQASHALSLPSHHRSPCMRETTQSPPPPPPSSRPRTHTSTTRSSLVATAATAAAAAAAPRQSCTRTLTSGWRNSTLRLACCAPRPPPPLRRRRRAVAR